MFFKENIRRQFNICPTGLAMEISVYNNACISEFSAEIDC